MTLGQYLARIAALRAAGNEMLAGQYENLYRLRTQRALEHVPESPSIVPAD